MLIQVYALDEIIRSETIGPNILVITVLLLNIS